MSLSTQQQIEIAGIKDGVIIMKDGSYRIILEVTATNFALKSDMEQNALVMQYQSFLNSLHFPIEIAIRSKRLDLTPYLAKIKVLGEKQPNELVHMLTSDYVDFVGKLVTIANIMKKSFYVTVSYSAVSVKQVGLFNLLFGQKVQKFDHLKISDVDFKAATEKLLENAGIVASGLGSMGLHCFQLSTEQIIELFYQIYNPAESTKERLTDASMLDSAVVSTKKIMPASGSQDEHGNAPTLIDNTHIVTASIKQESEQRKQGVNTAEEATPPPAENSATYGVNDQAAPQNKTGNNNLPELNELETEPANLQTALPPLDNLAKDNDGQQSTPTT